MGILFVALLLMSQPVSIHSAESVNEASSSNVSALGIPSSAITVKKTFTSATIDEPFALDPALNCGWQGAEVVQNVYETLIWYDGGSATEFVPVLALQVPSLANGLISPDGLTYTFNIRSGISFHDGTTLDADDVVYSLIRVLIINDPTGPGWMLGNVMIPGYPGPGAAVELSEIEAAIFKTGAMTVVLKLTHPYPAFLSILATPVGSIVSKEYVESHGGTQSLTANAWMMTNTMGTGPFKLSEWIEGEHITLLRFDDYWRGAARIDEVVIVLEPDYGTRLEMLASGNASTIYVPPSHKSDWIGYEGVRLHDNLLTFNLEAIGFNQNISASDIYNGNIPSDFFADVHVRRAFNYAFDSNKYLTEIMKNTGKQPNSVIPEGMFGWNSSVPKYSFNLMKAAEELALAINPDTGRSWLQDGFGLVLYYNAGSIVREAAALMLAADLMSLAPEKIYVTVQAMALPTYLSNMYGGTLACFFLGWGPDFADPDDYANPFLHENGTFSARCSVGNHTLSLMVEDAAGELDRDVRAQKYLDTSMSCYDNAYYLWMHQSLGFRVERTYVSGFIHNPMRGNYYYDYDISVGLPSAPQPTTAVPGDKLVSLSWTPPAEDGGSTVTSYRVYAGSSPDSIVPVIDAVYGLNCTVEGLENGLLYYFAVAASNIWGTGSISTTISAVPTGFRSAPTNFTGEAGDTLVALAWNPPIMNDTSEVTGYEISRGLSQEETSSIGGLPGDAATYIDTNVTAGTSYYYALFAVCGLSESPVAAIGPILAKSSISLGLRCEASTTSLGSGIWLLGNATVANGTGLEGLVIRFSYSVSEGQTWYEISMTTTSSNGSYAVKWIPSATGTYMIKASFSGNNMYWPEEEQLNLVVSAYADKYIFSVESNSVVSSFSFNSDKRELSFNVTGPSGTPGYARVAISRELVAAPSNIRVFMDGSETAFTLEGTTDAWILVLTYTHSTHSVVASLGAAQDVGPIGFDMTILVVALVAILPVVIIALYLKRSRSK